MKVTEICRYPIKSLGHEPLSRTSLSVGKTLPFDREWAVAHEVADIDWEKDEWARCGNFLRVAKAPKLAMITACLDEKSRTVSLSHSDRPDLTAAPDTPQGALEIMTWVSPLYPANRAKPLRIYRWSKNGLTDADFASISIHSRASLKALEEQAGRHLDPRRFRANIWIDDLVPWAENSWIGQEIQIGGSRLKVVERIGRCTATMANPETGEQDVDTLALLRDNWGHTDFGVNAVVIQNGEIATGDPVSL